MPAGGIVHLLCVFTTGSEQQGKHVASAVPAAFGSLDDVDPLFEAVKKSNLKYMMFETSHFHEEPDAIRHISNLLPMSVPRVTSESVGLLRAEPQ